MGLFKPAWMGKNEEKALKAVSTITDWTTLISIVKAAPLTSVRIAAIEKLPYPHVDQYTGRKCSLRFVKEQNILAEIFQYSSVYMLRLEAVNCITDIPLLEKLSHCSNSQTIHAAITKRIEDLSNNAVETKITDFNDKLLGINILVEYRMGLHYLENCGTFDEEKLREFNSITGNRLSGTDLEVQLKGAEMMINGMEEVRRILCSNVIETIATLEQLERDGIDLSKYRV